MNSNCTRNVFLEKRNDKAFKNSDPHPVLSLSIGLWFVEVLNPISISLQKTAQMCFLFFCNSQRFGTLSDCSCAAKNIVNKIYKAAACSDVQICNKDTVLARADIS